MQSLTEKFIFLSRNKDEIETLFSQKVIEFHEIFSDSLLLDGLGEDGQPLSSMRMEKSLDFEDDFFAEVVMGLQTSEPLLISTLIVDQKIDAYLSMFYLPFENVEGFYLLQQIAQWGGTQKTSYQVWSLLENCNLFDLCDHWDVIV